MLFHLHLGSVHKYFGGGAGQNGGGAKKVLSYQKGGTKKFSVVKGGGQKSLVKLKVQSKSKCTICCQNKQDIASD